MTRFSRLREVFFTGESDQVIELSYEHMNILPQFGGILPKYCAAFRLAALVEFEFDERGEIA